MSTTDIVKITVAELVNGWETRAETLSGYAQKFRDFGRSAENKQQAFQSAEALALQWAHENKLEGFHTEFLPVRDRQERWSAISEIIGWINQQIRLYQKYSPQWAAFKNAHDVLEYCYEIKHAQALIERLQVFALPYIEEVRGDIPEPMKIFYGAYLATIGTIETCIEQIATQRRGFDNG